MTQSHYLSQQKLDELKNELKDLKTDKRKEVAIKLAAAVAMGDLSENAAYEEAREDQTNIERRIVELEELINSALVIEVRKNTDSVGIGSKVMIKLDGNKKEFTIVGPQEADPLQSKISYESPLGKSFMGKKNGDEIELNVPKGTLKYKIIEIN